MGPETTPKDWAEMNSADGGEQCPDYQPLAWPNFTSSLADEACADGDGGCDTCLHWRQGRCAIYQGRD